MGIKITEIVSGPGGQAAFRESEIELRHGDFGAHDGPRRSQSEPVKRVAFLEIPPDWVNESVFTDRRQIGVCMRGVVRFTLADGTSKDFQTGDAWRLVDVNVTALQVAIVGSEPASCMITTID